MSPRFPEFEPLRLDHRFSIESHTARFPSYSDYNFTSLYSWNTNGQAAISWLLGNLVIRFPDYLTGETVCSFLGDAQQNETAMELLAYAEQHGWRPELKLLPPESVAGLDERQCEVVEDADNFDYLLSIDRLKTYEGGGLAKQRNKVNKFLRSWKPVTRILDLASAEVQHDLESLFLRWAQWKTAADTDIEHEKTALHRVFDLATTNRLMGVGVFVDGALAGFSISEVLDPSNGMMHFEKADPARYAGIYQFLMQETARLLSERGCTVLNYQQDLGLSGLRECKQGFRPIAYHKKFRVKRCT